MPPFPERESALLSRLNKARGQTGDKRTWVIGGKEANKEKDDERTHGVRRNKVLPQANAPTKDATSNGTPSVTGPEAQANELMASLSALDMSAVPEPTSAVEESLSAPSTSVFTHGTEAQLARLSYLSEGVLYEDAQLQIGIKSEYHGNRGRLALYFGNKISAPFESLTLMIENAEESSLAVNLAKMPTNTIEPMSQVEQVVTIECLEVFKSQPILKVSYLAGSLQTFVIGLPVYLTKFVEPIDLNSQAFFERWKLIGGPPREAQEIFKIKLDSSNSRIIDPSKIKKILKGFKLNLLESVDPNPINVVGAGVLTMTKAGKVGCLFRLEPNEEAKVKSAH